MPSVRQTAARVLVADDQPDVLEALRWLLTGEGYEPEFVSSTDGGHGAAARAAVRSAADGSELYPRHDVGPRGARAHSARPRPRPGAADRRHDRLGQRRHGGRSDAPRRARASCRSRGTTSTLLRDPASARSTRRARAQRSDRKQQREFEEARLIQRGLLPTAMPQIAGCDSPSSWQPADGVGGDCFDALALRRRRVGISIADVAGKGVPGGAADVEPAGRRARLRAGRRPRRRRSAPASIGCSAGNMAERPVRHLLLRVGSTRGAAIADLRQRRPQSAAARPRRRRRRAARDGGTVLGVFAESTYEQGELSLGRRRSLVFYTDGITEARRRRRANSAKIGLAARRCATARSARTRCSPRCSSDSRNLQRWRLEDDATLIVGGNG